MSQVPVLSSSKAFPCCGRHAQVDFAPGQVAKRRCRTCKRTFEVALVEAAMSSRFPEGLWKLQWSEIAKKEVA